MSSQAKVVIGGVVVGVLALWLLPSLLFKLLVVGIIAVPVVAYLMLDSTQRRKVRGHARRSLRS